MFTKQQYKVIALAIRQSRGVPDCRSLLELTSLLCSYFKQDNARFDEDEFREACGLTDYTGGQNVKEPRL